MILDALFLTKEQLEERKALEAEKKLKEEEAKLKKDEEEHKAFGEKLKKYKKKFLLHHNYEPFYIWGYDTKKKEVLCIFPDTLPGYCRRLSYTAEWFDSCADRYERLQAGIKVLEQKQKEDEQKES